jgi:hypothetical protein
MGAYLSTTIKFKKIISNLTACPGIIQDSDSSDA